jgi:glutamine synthetase
MNLFWDASGEGHLSDVAPHYIGGQLATLREPTAVFAPTVNTYKRLQPESAAGIAVPWGPENRTTALRVIAEVHDGCRVEHRVPGGNVNVYLAVAAAVAGGLYGIEKAIEPPAITVGNAYEDTTSARIPTTLAEAIPLFEESEVVREYLGEQFVDFYAATLRWEIEQECRHLTDWEVKRYLGYL